MTALATTESEHLAAVVDVMDTAGAVPYTLQDKKRVQVLPPAYSEVTIEPRAGGSFRMSATTSRCGYRISVVARGRTEDRAQSMRELTITALRGASLLVAGYHTTPVAFESGQPIDDDDEPGWYSGLLLFTYVI